MNVNGHAQNSGVRVVKIPRKVTKSNEEYMLDGYHYLGMEEALRKYTHPRLANQACWVYMQRVDPNAIIPEPATIVGKVIDNDDEWFMVELSNIMYYNALPNPKISIAFLGEKNREEKTIRVETITGLYLG